MNKVTPSYSTSHIPRTELFMHIICFGFVCLFVYSLLLFLYVTQLLYLTANRRSGCKDVNKLLD